MQIFYFSKKVKQNYEDEIFLQKHFGSNVLKSYKKFIISIKSSPNLFDAQSIYRGLSIEKLINKGNLWSARLNIKYRVNFECKGSELKQIKSITIKEMHSHNY